MSPADKRWLALISLLVVISFFVVSSCVPTYLYVAACLVGSCAVCCYKAEELRLLDCSGLNPRCGLSALPALRTWLAGGTGGAVPAAGRDRRFLRSSAWGSFVGSPADRHLGALNESAFSPRDFLMGSYLGRADGSPSGAGLSSGSHREQLRERLSRPNHGALTPNRRLSFGEPLGAVSRVTIAPPRRYPLQQAGTSPLGVFPPAQWDGFRRRSVLSQRNAAAHSPVTVKIARPDGTARLPLFEQLSSPAAARSPGFEPAPDPCSRESVLSVLRASRKRDVEEEERGHGAGQRSKRRRNDSGGSSHSAFESLLANGAPAQLVPKPGTLKRGMSASVMEESTLKRSRTSSISSGTGSPVTCGVPGSVRNPIRSSYSSSRGCAQRKVAPGLLLSPLLSPGTSRCHTPDRAAKKPREEYASPSGSPLRCDEEPTDADPGVDVRSSTPEPPPTPGSDSGRGSGKRKRRIQLVSAHRGHHISLPPPPELGYTITVKDLDMEKKAALSQIQKVLKEPEPENPASTSAPALSLSIFSKLPSSAPVFTSPAGPLRDPGPPPPTIDLTVTPPAASAATVTASPKLTNPLLESLKDMKRISALGPPAATPTAPVAAASVSLGIGIVKPEPALLATPTSLSATPTSLSVTLTSLLAAPTSLSSTPTSLSAAPTSLSTVLTSLSATPTSFSAAPTSLSAFAPVLSKPQSAMTGAFSFGGAAALGPPPAPAPSTTVTSSSSTLTPAQSGFKPIFGAAGPVPGPTPAQPSLKPVLEGVSPSLFGGLTNTRVTSSVPAPNPAPSPFGTPSTASSTSITQSSTQSLFATPSSTAHFTPSVFGGLANSRPTPTPTPPSTTGAPSVAQSSTRSLVGGPNLGQPASASFPSPSLNSQNVTASPFGAWSAPNPAPNPTPNSTFQFGASAPTTAAPLPSGVATTTSNAGAGFQFGAPKPAPAAASQGAFAFSQGAPATQFTGNPPTSTAPGTGASFGGSAFGARPSTPAKPFGFGGAAPSFGTPASTAAPAFTDSTRPAFGGSSSGFGSAPAPGFAFGAAPAAPQGPAPSGGFNFTASLQGPQFAFGGGGGGGAESKPSFGSSAPAFGTAAAPAVFNGPSTPQGFGAPALGAAPATFSIGAGSRPCGARQRLQARRQHTRKK